MLAMLSAQKGRRQGMNRSGARFQPDKFNRRDLCIVFASLWQARVAAAKSLGQQHAQEEHYDH